MYSRLSNKRAGCNNHTDWKISQNYKRSGCNKTMQVGKSSKINKRAGCNKAMQVGIFQKSIVKKST